MAYTGGYSYGDQYDQFPLPPVPEVTEGSNESPVSGGGAPGGFGVGEASSHYSGQEESGGEADSEFTPEVVWSGGLQSKVAKSFGRRGWEDRDVFLYHGERSRTAGSKHTPCTPPLRPQIPKS